LPCLPSPQKHFDVVEAAVLRGELPREALITGMQYLVSITDVDETEILKMCLEFWLHCANQLYSSERAFALQMLANAGPVSAFD
jgi:hypothetical protein